MILAAALAGCDGGGRAEGPATPVAPAETAEPCLVRHLGGDGIVTRLVRVVHDRSGRVLARVTLDYAAESERREAWAYDGLGRLVAHRTTVEDALPTRESLEQHSFDAAGDRVRTLTLDNGVLEVVTRSFDADGRPVEMRRTRGVWLLDIEQIAYDARGLPVVRELYGAHWTRWEMAYDAAGRLVERRRSLDGVLASEERWQWTDDGRLRASAVDRDGDGSDDYRERLIDRVDGWERLYDDDGDGRDDRRVLARVEGARETTFTDIGADGVFDAVVVVTRGAEETVTWADDDADGAPERVVVEVERPGYAETRRDDDGDGIDDARFVSRTDASGALLAEELYGPGGALVEATTLRYDADGRLVRVRRFGPEGAPIERIEQSYRCAWSPRPQP